MSNNLNNLDKKSQDLNKVSLLEKTNKLYDIFSKKLDNIIEKSESSSTMEVKEYLDSIFPNVIDTFEFGIIHLINTGETDNCYAIMNPYNPNKTLIIKREYAEQILREEKL